MEFNSLPGSPARQTNNGGGGADEAEAEGRFGNTSLTPGFQRMFTTATPASALAYTTTVTRNHTSETKGAVAMAMKEAAFSSSYPDQSLRARERHKDKISKKLRQLAQDALSKRLPGRACFYADKLVRLTAGRLPEDVVLLGRAHYQARANRKAVHVLEKYGLLAIKDAQRPLTRQEQHALFTAAAGSVPAEIDTAGGGQSLKGSRKDASVSNVHTTARSTLEAYLLAAQCLGASDPQEECLHLLDQILPCWEDEEEDAEGEGDRGERRQEESPCERQSRHLRNVRAAVVAAGRQNVADVAESSKSGSRGDNPRKKGSWRAETWRQAEMLRDGKGEPSSRSLRPTEQAQAVLTTIAALCFLRAQIFAGQDNRERAVAWCRHALEVDVYCVEALEFLADRKLLSQEEEQRLLARELAFDPGSEEEGEEDAAGTEQVVGDDWLRLMYATRLLCFSDGVLSAEEQHQTIHRAFAGLEALGFGRDAATLTAQAALAYYYQHDLAGAHRLCQQIRTQDPFFDKCLPLYLASLAELRLKTELYYAAHRLVDTQPRSAVAWFGVGCYYVCIHKNETAQRYFHKAAKLDHTFVPAWIGFGNAFAAQDESDQAMAAYRTAARLFPSAHLPLLYTGMEYLRTNNLSLALHFVREAHRLNPMDALVHNEWGVILYRRGHFREAAARFEKVLGLASASNKACTLVRWEATMVNLAHCCRKTGRFREAIAWYERALGLCTQKSGTYVALAFTHHLCGDLDRAIEYYHRGLGLKSDDAFASAMLTQALQDAVLGVETEEGMEGDRLGDWSPARASLIMSVPLPSPLAISVAKGTERVGRRSSVGSEIFNAMDEDLGMEEDSVDLSE